MKTVLALILSVSGTPRLGALLTHRGWDEKVRRWLRLGLGQLLGASRAILCVRVFSYHRHIVLSIACSREGWVHTYTYL